MSADAELDELERFETIVRGPGWVPDIDKGADYEEWTGKWYTPTRPDGTGGCSLALYADDEELLYAKYIAALRNAAPRLIRAARHLASLDKAGIVAENEALRQLLCETKRQRDEQRERAEAGALRRRGKDVRYTVSDVPTSLDPIAFYALLKKVGANALSSLAEEGAFRGERSGDNIALLKETIKVLERADRIRDHVAAFGIKENVVTF